MRTTLIAVVIASTLPLGWAVMADSPPPPPSPRPPEPKSVCIEVYQPVCGTKDGKQITYSNRCFANADHAADIAEGACGPAR